MKDGEFDRVRIPLADPEDADDPELDEFEQRLGVAATPAQLAAGSAILAGLVLIGLAALRRRRSKSGPDRAGGSA
jgi:MYXO-CTERM domain-containing protein